MKISLGTKQEQSVFRAAKAFDFKDELKGLGWHWDGDAKVWWTPADNLITARKFSAYMTPDARVHLDQLAACAEAKILASKASHADIIVPAPDGLQYRQFQLAGIQYLMEHDNAILGDEMGLGKTIQIIGLTNADPSISSVLVVCPATLRLNWKREFERWSTRGLKVEVVETKNQQVTDAHIVVTSYDLLEAHQAQFSELEWDLVVVDESHYAKNKRTKRSSALLGVPREAAKSRLIKAHKELFGDFDSWKYRMAVLDQKLASDPNLKAELDAMVRTGMQSRRTIFVSGTPIPNRPVELWPILERVDPSGLGRNFRAYTDRYCGAYSTDWGRDTNGASNLDELQIRLRQTCLIRRLKSDVLVELPAKTHQLIEIPPTGKLAKLVKQEHALDAKIKKTKAEQLTGSSALFTELSKVRHALAVAKIPAILDHIKATLDSCPKLVVMAHHHDVIIAIREEFPDAVVITGETGTSDRQVAVDRFQSVADCRLFIGSITAAGTGITLTAASTVIFAEQDWVPGTMQQAEDRLHRIGQPAAVLVQHLVVDGSLDAQMAQTLCAKSAVIAEALDSEVAMVPKRSAKKASEPRFGANDSAESDMAPGTLPAKQTEAIHECLKLLAANDPDHAQELNRRGFSAFDGKIGHPLAEADVLSDYEARQGLELIRKYTRQLPSELYSAATGAGDIPEVEFEIAALKQPNDSNAPAEDLVPVESAEGIVEITPINGSTAASVSSPEPSDKVPPISVELDHALSTKRRRRTSSTAADRTRKSLAALHAAGGRAILLRLTPSAATALERYMEANGEMDRTHAINRLIEVGCMAKSDSNQA